MAGFDNRVAPLYITYPVVVMVTTEYHMEAGMLSNGFVLFGLRSGSFSA